MGKKFGEFYTPQRLVDYVIKLLPNTGKGSAMSILEPSGGDGRFILSILKKWNEREINSTVVEIKKEACIIARKNLKRKNARVFNQDFLFYKVKKRSFDLVIGNPPYISKKHLALSQLDELRKILTKNNISLKADKNIWPAFILQGERALKAEGVMALVLPFELLQVKFSEEIQQFLIERFARIEIYTFQNLIFDSAGQDTIILIAHKKSTSKGLFVFDIEKKEFENSKDTFPAPQQLCRKTTTNISNLKWSSLVLCDDELNYLSSLSSTCSSLEDYIGSRPGLVTAANNYFIVDHATVEKYHLNKYAKPVIQKGLFAKDDLIFGKREYDKLVSLGLPTYFLDFSSYELGSNRYVEEYLNYGKSLNIHERYKCSIREHWFKVPIVKPEKGFFFKRSNGHPKFLKNTGNVYTTDSAYNVYPRKGFNINSIIYSFYNPLTLCFSELYGRHYGGGVLELTPNEFRKLPLPYIEVSSKEFTRFKQDFKNKTSIHDIFAKNSNNFQCSLKNVDSDDLLRLDRIYAKLVKRRMHK